MRLEMITVAVYGADEKIGNVYYKYAKPKQDVFGTLAAIGTMMTGKPWIQGLYEAGKAAFNGDIGHALGNGLVAGASGGLFGDKMKNSLNGAQTIMNGNLPITSPLYKQYLDNIDITQ